MKDEGWQKMRIEIQLALFFVVSGLTNSVSATPMEKHVFKKHVCVVEGLGFTAQHVSLLKAQEDALTRCKLSVKQPALCKDQLKCEQVEADAQAELNAERLEEILRILKESQSATGWPQAVVRSTSVLGLTMFSIAFLYFCIGR
jgi:hypothetical protein